MEGMFRGGGANCLLDLFDQLLILKKMVEILKIGIFSCKCCCYFLDKKLKS
jgi:hypothetical protein